MKLKEKECSKCPQCNKIYFDFFRVREKSCNICKIPTERDSYYSRVRLERFAVVYTLSLIISVLLLFADIWDKLRRPYVISLFLFFIPGLLFFIHSSVNDYLSSSGSLFKKTKKELSVFKEYYLSGDIPTEKELAFSLPKYFEEASSFVGIVSIFVFLCAGMTLFNKLLW